MSGVTKSTRRGLSLGAALLLGACIVTPYEGPGHAPRVAPEPPPPPDEPSLKPAARSAAEQKLQSPPDEGEGDAGEAGAAPSPGDETQPIEPQPGI